MATWPGFGHSEVLPGTLNLEGAKQKFIGKSGVEWWDQMASGCSARGSSVTRQCPRHDLNCGLCPPASLGSSSLFTLALQSSCRLCETPKIFLRIVFLLKLAIRLLCSQVRVWTETKLRHAQHLLCAKYCADEETETQRVEVTGQGPWAGWRWSRFESLFVCLFQSILSAKRAER